MTIRSISVLICTYNRAPLLAETLAAVQRLTPPAGCTVEIVVVDNNSTDNTRGVLADANAAGPFSVVALREFRQGKSFALNTGFGHTRGDVVALTDDDVLPAADWLCRIVDAFRTRDVTFVFGKVLPRWATQPPPELLLPEASGIWGPLAIVDYGDEAADYLPESTSQRLPIGANLAFLRRVLAIAGGWRTDLGKIDNTLISGEDHEIFMRLRRMRLYRGFYDPRAIVRHLVPASRVTRSYFRRWFFWHGKTEALMLADLYPELDMTRVPHVLGIPRFAYRQAFAQLVRWIRTRRASAVTALSEELRLLQHAGLFSQCWRLRRARQSGAGARGARLALHP